MIFYLLFIIIQLTNASKNYITNGDFESGNWGTDYPGYCKRVTDNVHSGKYSYYCHDTLTDKSTAMYTFVYDVFPGLRYNMSGYIKMKDCTAKSYIWLIAEAQYDAKSGIWDCKSSKV